MNNASNPTSATFWLRKVRSSQHSQGIIPGHIDFGFSAKPKRKKRRRRRVRPETDMSTSSQSNGRTSSCSDSQETSGQSNDEDDAGALKASGQKDNSTYHNIAELPIERDDMISAFADFDSITPAGMVLEKAIEHSNSLPSLLQEHRINPNQIKWDVESIRRWHDLLRPRNPRSMDRKWKEYMHKRRASRYCRKSSLAQEEELGVEKFEHVERTVESKRRLHDKWLAEQWLRKQEIKEGKTRGLTRGKQAQLQFSQKQTTRMKLEMERYRPQSPSKLRQHLSADGIHVGTDGSKANQTNLSLTSEISRPCGPIRASPSMSTLPSSLVQWHEQWIEQQAKHADSEDFLYRHTINRAVRIFLRTSRVAPQEIPGEILKALQMEFLYRMWVQGKGHEVAQPVRRQLEANVLFHFAENQAAQERADAQQAIAKLRCTFTARLNQAETEHQALVDGLKAENANCNEHSRAEIEEKNRTLRQEQEMNALLNRRIENFRRTEDELQMTNTRLREKAETLAAGLAEKQARFIDETEELENELEILQHRLRIVKSTRATLTQHYDDLLRDYNRVHDHALRADDTVMHAKRLEEEVKEHRQYRTRMEEQLGRQASELEDRDVRQHAHQTELVQLQMLLTDQAHEIEQGKKELEETKGRLSQAGRQLRLVHAREKTVEAASRDILILAKEQQRELDDLRELVLGMRKQRRLK
jgi:hypothetical protein